MGGVTYNKLLIFVFIFLFSYIIDSHSDIKDWLGDAVYTKSNGYSLSTQARDYYFGGGFGIKTPQETIVPFNVQPPSIRAGCGGIDIAFGGFSYLNPSYLVDFGKKVIAAAPAMAFQMALQTFCSSCEGIMNKLTSLADTINGLNMNSCEAATAMAGAGMTLLSNEANVKMASGKINDWLTHVDTGLTSAQKAIDNLLSGKFGYKSGRNNLDKAITEFFAEPECKSFLDYMFATITNSSINGCENTITAKSNSGGITSPTASFFARFTDNEKKLIRYLFGDIVKINSGYNNNDDIIGNYIAQDSSKGGEVGGPASVMVSADGTGSTQIQTNEGIVGGENFNIVKNPVKQYGEMKVGSDKLPGFEIVSGVHNKEETENMLLAWIFGYNYNEGESTIENLQNRSDAEQERARALAQILNIQNTNTQNISVYTKIECNNNQVEVPGAAIDNTDGIHVVLKKFKVDPICQGVKKVFEDIASNYENYSSLNDEEIMYLSMINFPIYKLLNSVSIFPGGVRDILNEIVYLFTVQLTTTILQQIGYAYSVFLNELYSGSVNKATGIEKETVSGVLQNVSQVMSILSKFDTGSLQEMREKLKTTQMVADFAAKIQAQIAKNPLSGNYFFSIGGM
jgi:hypothetical protein